MTHDSKRWGREAATSLFLEQGRFHRDVAGTWPLLRRITCCSEAWPGARGGTTAQRDAAPRPGACSADAALDGQDERSRAGTRAWPTPSYLGLRVP